MGGVALQLRFLYEFCPPDMGATGLCLVSAPPKRPCDDCRGLDTPLCEFDSDAADFLN
jgi:hypothetical protein